MRDFDNHRRGFHGHRMGKPFLLGAALLVLLAVVVMTLWNALLPAIIGATTIGFWQALGLLVLSRILFGGLGLRPGMFGMAREHRRMHERWMNMTPEEREAFIQQRRAGFMHRGHFSRFGGCGHHHESDKTPPQSDEKPAAD